MTNHAQALQPDVPADPHQVWHVIDLLEELHGVIRAENNLLDGGLPASLAKTVARKTQLATELDTWLGVMRSGEFGKACEPEDIAQLVGRLQSLRVLMGENTLAIKRSMEATRRRIDGIMRALREETRPVGIYGGKIPANGAHGRFA